MTRPGGGAARRANGATTVAERADDVDELATSELTVTPNAVSTTARACHPS
jgi:hypothetical protein